MLVRNNLERDARVRKEACSLAQAGARVVVIGIGNHYPDDIDAEPYELLLSQPMIHGKPVLPRWGRDDVWYPLRVLTNLTVTRSRQRRLASRATKYGYLNQVIQQEMIETAMSLDEIDIVHANDLDTLFAGYVIANRRKARLIYDSHELYLELHFLADVFRSDYAKIEESIFPQIDALITPSPQIAERLLAQYGDKKALRTVLYNGSPSIAKSTRPVHRPVRLFFQGAFAHDRNLIELVSAMDGLRDAAVLTLQGWGEDELAIRQLIADLCLEETVTLLEPCHPYEVMASAAQHDIGIINSLPMDENFMVTLPNKLFDYMCAGLAVASTDLPPIKEIINREACGITYTQRGIKHTQEILRALISRPDEISRMKQAALKAAPYYAWPAQAKKLIQLYQQLIQHGQMSDENCLRDK
jgi:glycosyltransferase involved in cell wall biosynthesis